MQGVHRFAARRAGGGATVPVLVTPEGAIGESQQIVEWVDERLPQERRLFPANGSRDEVEQLCDRFDTVLGPHARRLIYVHMLRDKPLALRFNNEGVPAWEERVIRYGWPAMGMVIRRALEIEPAQRGRGRAGRLGRARLRREPARRRSRLPLRRALHGSRSDLLVTRRAGHRAAGLRRRAAAARADACRYGGDGAARTRASGGRVRARAVRAPPSGAQRLSSADV